LEEEAEEQLVVVEALAVMTKKWMKIR